MDYMNCQSTINHYSLEIFCCAECHISARDYHGEMDELNLYDIAGRDGKIGLVCCLIKHMLMEKGLLLD